MFVRIRPILVRCVKSRQFYVGCYWVRLAFVLLVLALALALVLVLWTGEDCEVATVLGTFYV